MICTIKGKKKISDAIWDICIECPEMAEKAKPGQFLHIDCGCAGAYLRRPISICEVVNNTSLRFIYREKGEGTKGLTEKNIGDKIDVLGPLGRGFSVDAENDETIVAVGGGIGIFPLLELTKKYGKKANVLLGFGSEKDIVLDNDFSKYTEKVFVATEDGSCGFKGYVTDLLKNILKSNKVDKIFSCGPMPMMKAVAKVAEEFGVSAEVSLEERMGCGIGACVTCTCNINGGRKRVCKDGPVFNASEVEWDA